MAKVSPYHIWPYHTVRFTDEQGLDAVENVFNEDFEVEGYCTGACVGDEIEMYIELS
jgi:hypothetical protein